MNGKSIVLGVSGGIAAYKACEVASRLTQAGATVYVVLTAAAQRFVTPLTFQALTHQPVHTSLWPADSNSEAGTAAAMAHISLAEADAILIAPASADIIARLAHGLADDLLTTLVLATRAPVLVAPAMNPLMLSNPATQSNLQTLSDRGVHIIEPEHGRMACEHVGSGRLPPSEIILAQLDAVLSDDAPVPQLLAGKKVLVTAGPTRELLDPVRFLSNRSSGKMGYALAETAVQRGAEVLLVSGPTNLPTPPGVQRVNVTSTREMLQAVTERAPSCDIIIGAAAPADWQAAAPAAHKMKKADAPHRTLHLELVPTPDIIGAVGQGKATHQIIIGFAAETRDVVAEAQRKLSAKGLDAVVANDVSQSDAGFDVETNRVTWVTAEGVEEWPLLFKREVAARIWEKVATM